MFGPTDERVFFAFDGEWWIYYGDAFLLTLQSLLSSPALPPRQLQHEGQSLP
jgi:hypothetical protein